jgi:hypothetical protein
VLSMLMCIAIIHNTLRHRSLTDLVLKCRDFQPPALVNHTHTAPARVHMRTKPLSVGSFRRCTHICSTKFSALYQQAIRMCHLKCSEFRIKFSWLRKLPTSYCTETWVCLRYLVIFIYFATHIILWNWNVYWARGEK